MIFLSSVKNWDWSEQACHFIVSDLMWRFFVDETHAKDLTGCLDRNRSDGAYDVHGDFDYWGCARTVFPNRITLPLSVWWELRLVFLLLEMGLVLSVS